MKNFKKLFAISLSTFVFAGNISAAENNIDKTEVENQLASSLKAAVADINQPIIKDIVKVQLNDMSYKLKNQNFLAKSNSEETKPAKVNVVAD